jgi:hypothetical protein
MMENRVKASAITWIAWLIFLPLAGMLLGWIGGHLTAFVTGDFLLRTAARLGVPTGGMALPELCAFMSFLSVYLGRPVIMPVDKK